MMKKYIILVLLIGILGCSKSPDDKRLGLYNDGIELIRKADFLKANEKFSELKASFPESYLGQIGDAKILEGQLLYHDALHLYLSVTDNDNSIAEAHRSSGRMYDYLGWQDQAVSSYTLAVGLPNVELDAYREFLSLLFRSKLPDKVERLKVNAINAGISEAEQNIIKAWTEFLNSNYEELDNIENELTKAQLTAGGYQFLADYFEERGFINKSIATSKKVLKADGNQFNHIQAHFLRCLRNNYLYEARQVIADVRRLDKEQTLLPGMLMRYGWESGDILKTDSATIAFRQKHDKKMTPVLSEIKTQWLKSDLQTCLSDIDYAKVLASDFQFSETYSNFILGEIEMVSLIVGDVPGIGADLRISHGFLNGDRRLVLTDLRMNRQAGQEEKYQNFADSILEQYNNDPYWLYHLGDIAADSFVNDFSSADLYFSRLLDIQKSNSSALTSWVKMYLRNFKFEKALETIESYPDLINNNPKMKMLASEVYIRNNQPERSLLFFEEAFSEVSGDLSAPLYLSKIMKRLGGVSNGERILSIMLAENEKNPDAYYIVSKNASEQKKFDQGKQFAEAGLSIEPDNIDLEVQIARALFGLGEKERGKEMFVDIINRDKGNADAAIYYSYSLAEEGIEQRYAENLARRAFFLDGGTVESVLNMSKVYYLFGSYRLARGEAMRAAKSFRDSPEAFFHLGQANYELGHEETKKAFERAIELGLYGENLKEAREALATL